MDISQKKIDKWLIGLQKALGREMKDASTELPKIKKTDLPRISEDVATSYKTI